MCGRIYGRLCGKLFLHKYLQLERLMWSWILWFMKNRFFYISINASMGCSLFSFTLFFCSVGTGTGTGTLSRLKTYKLKKKLNPYQVDSSLVKLTFEADGREEWIYRGKSSWKSEKNILQIIKPKYRFFLGSTRLGPLYTEMEQQRQRREQQVPYCTVCFQLIPKSTILNR